jgi:hypothetical protein
VASVICQDGRELLLAGDLSIGRAATNDLVIDDPTVSRHHAELNRCLEGGWLIEDHGSFNGTFVNGMRLAQRVHAALRHGDRLCLGPHQHLVFCWPEQGRDDYRTIGGFELFAKGEEPLSPFQLQVVRCLCAAWLKQGAKLPSNVEIAAMLGTPDAEDAIKAALRRAYAKAGLSHLPPQLKRVRLCAAARQRGWI